MSRDRVQSHLDEMQQAAMEIGGFLQEMTKADFLANLVVQRAVGMNLLMIGEAVSRVLDEYPEVAAEHADIPWIKMRGMQNSIAHGYFKIDLDTVWDTATNSIPQLVDALGTLRNWRAQGE